MIDTPVCSSPAMIARSSGAAPRHRGQQRRVHVDHLVRRQQRLLDQHAVGAHARDLRLGGGDPLQRLRLVQPLGLDHLEAELTRPQGHRRRRDLAAAALRPVGPRDDELRSMRAAGQPLEDDGREVRGAEVDRVRTGR